MIDLRWITNHDDVVEVYEAEDGWRYRVTNSGNHEKVEQGTEAYTRPASAVIAAVRHHPWIADAPETPSAPS